MIIRTYSCNECGALFECEMESNDGDPDCPACSVVMEWRPQSFNIGTVKSKAIDVTQKLIEEDYGMSNLRDGVREGETYAMPPRAKHAGEVEAETREAVEFTKQTGGLPPELAAQVEHSKATFFGGGAMMGGGGLGGPPMQQMLAAAASSKNEPGSVDPMAALHEGGKKGTLPTRARIIARG